MSQEELVNAYVGGAISRRSFIQRLVASGVALGAASAYAVALAPEAKAGGEDPDNTYGDNTVKIVSKDLGVVKNEKSLAIRITTEGTDVEGFENAAVALVAGEPIGRLNYSSAEGTTNATLPLRNVNPLRHLDEIEIEVRLRHRNKTNGDLFLLAKDKRILKKQA